MNNRRGCIDHIYSHAHYDTGQQNKVKGKQRTEIGSIKKQKIKKRGVHDDTEVRPYS